MPLLPAEESAEQKEKGISVAVQRLCYLLYQPVRLAAAGQNNHKYVDPYLFSMANHSRTLPAHFPPKNVQFSHWTFAVWSCGKHTNKQLYSDNLMIRFLTN